MTLGLDIAVLFAKAINENIPADLMILRGGASGAMVAELCGEIAKLYVMLGGRNVLTLRIHEGFAVPMYIGCVAINAPEKIPRIWTNQ
jgi:hypothetical protein